VIHEDDGVVLQNIEIEPEFQGRGIGSELICRIIEDADARGLAVKLQALKVNSGAIRLYERLGFVLVEESDTHFQMRRKAAPTGTSQPGIEQVHEAERLVE
jgi:ribosomal protein S18 acetylase RimI-like enzyme